MHMAMQGHHCKLHNVCLQSPRVAVSKSPKGYLHRDVCSSRYKAPRQKPAVCAVSSGEGPVVGTDLLGGPLRDLEKEEAEKRGTVDDVELESGAGIDYSGLAEALKAEEFQKADDITREMVIELAGSDAKARGWVYFSEVQYMPEKDLQTMDKLWKISSGDKFGFSVQRRIFLQRKRLWLKFFQAIDWVVGENNDYRKWPNGFIYTTKAKEGHLPLTNCLRGTQLLEAILMHPAFGGPPKDPK